jgi:hypothetical protein
MCFDANFERLSVVELYRMCWFGKGSDSGPQKA